MIFFQIFYYVIYTVFNSYVKTLGHGTVKKKKKFSSLDI